MHAISDAMKLAMKCVLFASLSKPNIGTNMLFFMISYDPNSADVKNAARVTVAEVPIYNPLIPFSV